MESDFKKNDSNRRGFLGPLGFIPFPLGSALGLEDETVFGEEFCLNH